MNYKKENNTLLKDLLKKVDALLTDNKNEAVTKKKTKKVKDPNAPKGARGPWILFSSKNKDKYQKKFPDASYQEIVKKMSLDWKALSDSKKAKYQEAAKKDKLRYEREMEEYNKKHIVVEEPKPKKISKSKVKPVEVESEESSDYSLEELELSE